LILFLIGFNSGCTKKELLFDEKKDFSSGQATFRFSLGSEGKARRILVTTDLQYVFGSSYRLEAYLSTPSDKLQKAEINQASTDEKNHEGSDGRAVSGTTKRRSDEHLLFEVQPEPGSYRLDLAQTELAPRAMLHTITVRVEK
jgi:hypothetical protein